MLNANGVYMLWGLPVQAVLQVVDYMHSNRIVIDKQNVLDLTQVAHRFQVRFVKSRLRSCATFVSHLHAHFWKFQIDMLMKHLVSFMLAYLNVETCLKAKYIYDKLKIETGLDRIDRFIKENFLEVLQTDAFLDATANTLAGILESDDISVAGTFIVCPFLSSPCYCQATWNYVFLRFRRGRYFSRSHPVGKERHATKERRCKTTHLNGQVSINEAGISVEVHGVRRAHRYRCTAVAVQSGGHQLCPQQRSVHELHWNQWKAFYQKKLPLFREITF